MLRCSLLCRGITCFSTNTRLGSHIIRTCAVSHTYRSSVEIKIISISVSGAAGRVGGHFCCTNVASMIRGFPGQKPRASVRVLSIPTRHRLHPILLPASALPSRACDTKSLPGPSNPPPSAGSPPHIATQVSVSVSIAGHVSVRADTWLLTSSDDTVSPCRPSALETLWRHFGDTMVTLR